MLQKIRAVVDSFLPYTRRQRWSEDGLSYFVVYRRFGPHAFDVDGFVTGVAAGGRASERAERWHRFRAVAEAEA